METGRIRIGTFYISIAILLLVETAADFLMSREWRYPFAILGGVRLAEIALLTAVFQIRGGGLGVIGLGRGQIVSGIRRGALWSAGFGGVVLSGFGILTLLGINPLRLVHVRLPESAFEIAIYFIVGGVVGPGCRGDRLPGDSLRFFQAVGHDQRTVSEYGHICPAPFRFWPDPGDRRYPVCPGL